MSKTVDITIICKEPPVGRCHIYVNMAIVAIEHYKNVLFHVKPNGLRGENEPQAPAMMVNGCPLEPEDNIMVSADELLRALRGGGALLLPGHQEPKAQLEKAVDSYVPPGR